MIAAQHREDEGREKSVLHQHALIYIYIPAAVDAAGSPRGLPAAAAGTWRRAAGASSAGRCAPDRFAADLTMMRMQLTTTRVAQRVADAAAALRAAE